MINLSNFLNAFKHTTFKKLFVLALCFAFTYTQTVWGKAANFAYITLQSEVTGTIQDANGNPIPGANIKIVGTTTGTQTDINGNYKIAASKGSVLEISFLGMKSQRITVGDNPTVNVSMQEDLQSLEEVVLVGYGTKKKSELTGAISNIKSDEIFKIPATNISNVLAGRFSGTFIRSTTGTPGISSDVRVRGNSSWNTAPPVYVIDGVVRDKFSFDALDANEIDEITILKDAASAAIYGSRSSNGVILVSTKQGKVGKTTIDIFTTYGTESTGKLPEYMPLKDGLNLSRSLGAAYTDADIEWALKNNPKGQNYYDAAYHNPSIQKHSVNVTGGSENVKYFLGGSFINEDGFLPNVWFKKYNLRANVEAKINKNLTAKLNLSNNFGTRNRFNFTYDYGSNDLNNLWGKLLYWDVFTPAYINDKPVNPGWLGNLVEIMQNGGYWRNQNQQSDALINLTYKIPNVPGLSVGSTFSKNIQNGFTKNFAKKQLLYNFKKVGNIFTDEIIDTQLSGDPGTEYINNQSSKGDSHQLNFQVNYDNTFGEHTIGAVAIYEQYDSDFINFTGTRNNFPLYPTDQFFAASKNNSDWSVNGGEAEDSRLSYIGRIDYDYAKKYLLTVSARYDGSIRFSPKNRWGLFPSVSAGWVVSNEDFYSNSSLSNTLTSLKFRFSYGSTGNDAIGGWQWIEQYNISTGSYYLGSPGTAAPRLTYGGIPNENLTWEKSDSYNLGIDLGILNNLNVTVDLWKRHSYDILGSRILVLASEFGGTLPATNYGVIDAKGLDFEINYGTKAGTDFTFNARANFGLATTEVIKRDVAAGAQDVDNPNGKTLSYGTGYRTSGIFKNQADLDKLPADYRIFGAIPELGMMNFEDLSGPDGKPDGKIDDYDRVVLGDYFGSNAAPISFGLGLDFAYKNFNLSMLFAGLAGYKISYNDPWGRNFGGGGKVPLYHADSWSTENPNGSTPKIYPWGDNRSSGYTQTSDFNVYDGSFVRMKDLSIAYSINPNHLSDLGITKAQISASASNLFYLSKFKFYDPEISQFMSYPIMKGFNVGLNIQF